LRSPTAPPRRGRAGRPGVRAAGPARSRPAALDRTCRVAPDPRLLRGGSRARRGRAAGAAGGGGCPEPPPASGACLRGPGRARRGVDQRDARRDPLRARPGADRLRWTDRAGWHLPPAFYGEVPEHPVAELRERLAGAAARSRPLPLLLAGGGLFGHRTLWTAV